MERAQGLRLVGRGRRASGPATTSRTSPPDKRPVLPARPGRRRPGRPRRRRPVHHAGRRQGLALRTEGHARRPAAGALRAAGVAGHQPALPPAGQPDPPGVPAQGQPVEPLAATSPASEVFPYVFTTYRLTEHHTAGGMSRWLPYLSELQPEFFCEVSPRARRRARARERRLGHASSRPARAIEARVLVTDRMTPLTINGPHDPPDRPALPLGRRQRCRRRAATRPTTCSASPSTRTCTSRSRRSARATSSPGRRPRGAALPAARRRVPVARGHDRRDRQRARRPQVTPRRPHAERGRPASRTRAKEERDGLPAATSCRGRTDPAAGRRAGQDAPPRKGFFTDTSICIGCKACEVACKEWNAIPEDGLALLGSPTTTPAPWGRARGATSPSSSRTRADRRRTASGRRLVELGMPGVGARCRHAGAIGARAGYGACPRPSRTTGRAWVTCSPNSAFEGVGLTATAPPSTARPWTLPDFRWLMASDVCKHCTHAACLDVCPTGALFRTEFGTVVVQDDVCNGCGYCVARLPVRGDRAPRTARAPPFTATATCPTSASPRSARSATTGSGTARPRRAPRPARRRRSSSATSTELRDAARDRRAPAARPGLHRGPALRRQRERRRRRHRLDVPAARRARGLRPAPGPGRDHRRPAARCSARPGIAGARHAGRRGGSLPRGGRRDHLRVRRLPPPDEAAGAAAAVRGRRLRCRTVDGPGPGRLAHR